MWIQVTCISKHNKEYSRNYLSLLPSVTPPVELEVQPQHLGGLRGSQAQLPHRERADPGVPLSASVPRAFLQPSLWSCCFPAGSAMASSRARCVLSSSASPGPCGEQGLGQQDKPARLARNAQLGKGMSKEKSKGAFLGLQGGIQRELLLQAPLLARPLCPLPRAAVLAWTEGLALSGQRQPVLGISWSQDQEFCSVTELHLPCHGELQPWG